MAKKTVKRDELAERIAAEIRTGMPLHEAVAMAFTMARREFRKAHPRADYPPHLAPAAPKKNPARKKKKRATRRNPGGDVQRELHQAAARFEGFRGEPAKGALRVTVPPTPRVMLTIGECVGIMYRTRRDGQVDEYLHRFNRKSRPTLCCSSDGKKLYLLDGAYSVTDRGIEDSG